MFFLFLRDGEGGGVVCVTQRLRLKPSGGPILFHLKKKNQKKKGVELLSSTDSGTQKEMCCISFLPSGLVVHTKTEKKKKKKENEEKQAHLLLLLVVV